MSNFSFTSTEPLADNGVGALHETVSQLETAAQLETGITPKYYAGVVPFIAGLEIFYTVIPTGTDDQVRVEVTVHVTGYMTGDGEQRRMLWRGHNDVSTLQMGSPWRIPLSPPPTNTLPPTTITTTTTITNNTIKKNTINSSEALSLPIPVQHHAEQGGTYEDIYGLEQISLTYTEEGHIPYPNTIGLVMFPPINPGDTRVIRIVNTTLEASLMIGARNIIITDPKP